MFICSFVSNILLFFQFLQLFFNNIMSIITLTTDYGTKDYFVGALKGKILTLLPDSKIIDISHHIDPFNIFEASYIIGASYLNFPKKTIHIIGVDAELNKENCHVVVEWNDHYFIGADNGILSLLTQKSKPQSITAIEVYDKMPHNASDLDVFVAVASHITKGGTIGAIGKKIDQLKQVTDLHPVVSRDKNSILGYVVYIDHFGNVVTNISKQLFEEVAQGRTFEIPLLQKMNQKKASGIKTIYTKYSDIGNQKKYEMKEFEGDKVAIFNEAGFLEIGIFRSNPHNIGSASTLLGIGYRDIITVTFFEE
jgi:S-adenosylmethionine hydrolase